MKLPTGGVSRPPEFSCFEISKSGLGLEGIWWESLLEWLAGRRRICLNNADRIASCSPWEALLGTACAVFVIASIRTATRLPKRRKKWMNSGTKTSTTMKPAKWTGRKRDFPWKRKPRRAVVESAEESPSRFTLRGVKDSLPYHHDGRLLTLEDTVKFFDLVLQLKLDAKERGALVAFMRRL